MANHKSSKKRIRANERRRIENKNITNKVKIVSEAAYLESIWTKQLLSGLTKELKKRRIYYEQTTCVENIFQDDFVCIIGISNIWTQNVIAGIPELYNK